MQNLNMDHIPIPPFPLRAEGLSDCLSSGSTVTTTVRVLDNLVSLGDLRMVDL